MKILQNSLLASLLGLVAYVVVTVLVWPPPVAPQPTEMSRDEIVAQAKAAVPSWEFNTVEADLFMEELRNQKTELNRREKELQDLAERLQIERLELNTVTQAVYQLQLQVEAQIVRINAEEAANIKKLSRTYAAMSPEGAAPILKEMEESTLIKILAIMKETETAPILEAMSRLGPEDAKRVAKVSERLRFYLAQTPPPAKK